MAFQAQISGKNKSNRVSFHKLLQFKGQRSVVSESGTLNMYTLIILIQFLQVHTHKKHSFQNSYFILHFI